MQQNRHIEKETKPVSARTIRIVIFIALLAHGIAHMNAIIALISQGLSGPSSAVVTVQSWLFPSFSPNLSALLALPFWVISGLGFLAAAASFWGIFLPALAWRRVALMSAIISSIGIVLFSAIWPGTPNDLRLLIHPFAAMFMNIAVIATQLLLHWPPLAMFGK